MAERNKTAKYLYSVFSTESQEFKKYYNSLRRKGIFIGDDYYVKQTGVFYNNHLFVLVDVENTENFDEALSFFRVYENYEDDYDVNGRSHMIVFRINPKFRKAMYYFKKSQFSKMYTEDYLDVHYQMSKPYEIIYNNHKVTLEDCTKLIDSVGSVAKFMADVRVSPYAVLSGSNTLRELLNEIYGFKPSAQIKRSDQLDSKIDLKEEIFRYDSEVSKEVEQ